ncbi:MAG: cytochrome-c oxidase, cbb3-type subunit III [Pseudomonadota bacterium]
MSGDQKRIDEPTGVETTGHAWDGLEELNNPLPRWWLTVFYITVIWSVAYWVFMPSWPTLSGHLQGLRGHTERANVAEALDALEDSRSVFMSQLAGADTLNTIQADPALFQFARQVGASAFGNNCATCHGSGGQGAPGYPVLRDDDWLWGGTLDQIRYTLQVGIRSTNDDTLFSIMPAFGQDGILDKDDIKSVVEYVRQISGQEAETAFLERGETVFQEQCVACHGENGEGLQALGAPNLTDVIWLYGGDREALTETITYSRYGVMPHWNERLDEGTIAALAIHVHSLGGGE